MSRKAFSNIDSLSMKVNYLYLSFNNVYETKLRMSLKKRVAGLEKMRRSSGISTEDSICEI